MGKKKRKLTAAEKKAKKEKREKYEWVFMQGKQVRIKRPKLIDGMLEEDYFIQNADPIALHQAGMWEYIEDDY